MESGEFLSLQGIVLWPGGIAIVADHANGLLRVDLNRGAVQRLDTPPGATLIGLDGLTLVEDGAVLAIQNGVRPNRVLKIELDASGTTVIAATVLESGHIMMAAPSLGVIATGGDFFFVGNAGWSRFEEPGAPPTPPRSVPIYRIKLGLAKAPR